jgi:hypothetical protein
MTVRDFSCHERKHKQAFMSFILEMALTSNDNSIRYLADATIREADPDKAARELVTILAIQCPTNGLGSRKLMHAFLYLYQTGR